MIRWFLSILTAIVLVGMSFTTSSAWEFVPDNEVCSLSSYSAENGLVATTKAAWSENCNLKENILFNTETATINPYNTYINPVWITSESPGVLSCGAGLLAKVHCDLLIANKRTNLPDY